MAAFFTNIVRVPIRTLTNSAVVVISSDCEIDLFSFCNKTAGTVTATVQDGNGGNLVYDLSIPAYTTVTIPYGDGQGKIGVFAQGGFQWLASSGSAIDAGAMARTQFPI